MMPSHIVFNRSSSLTWLCAASLFFAGCASTNEKADEESSAEQVSKTALAQRINACALQRALFDQAQDRFRTFNKIANAVRLAQDPDAKASRRGKLYGGTDWDTTSVTDVEMAIDPDGTRVLGRARSWRDLAIFAERISNRSVIEFGVSAAARDENGTVAFRLEPTPSLAPFRGVTFGPELFPPKQTDSLEEYADELCDFGGDAAPYVENNGPLVFEKVGAVEAGDWQRTALRVTLSDWAMLDQALRRASDYHGVSAQVRGQELVVDVYQVELSDSFAPSAWLAKHIPSQHTSEHRGLGEPPEGSRLITWREEGDYPVGVSRSLLTNFSWYRYQQSHQLYHALADDHARVMLADVLRERNARALRASLCFTRAYTQPLEDAPDADTRPLRAAEVTFRAPVDGEVDRIDIDKLRIFADGHTEWTLSSPAGATLDGVRDAFSRCMGAAEIDAQIGKQGKRRRWSGTATASAEGLFTSDYQEVELPRFKGGREFVMEIRQNEHQFRRELYELNRSYPAPRDVSAIRRIVPPAAGAGHLMSEITEVAQVFAADLTALSQRPMSPEGWDAVHPKLYELEATAKPANMLGFVTQLFDLQRQIVPAEFTIAPHDDGSRMVLRATFYAFSATE